MANDKTPVKLPEVGKKKPATIGDLLESKAVVARLQQIVPQHVSPERLLRIFMLATHKTPLLQQGDPMTLLGAMMSCASLGLEPNTLLGHAYLIPFKNRQKGTVDIQLIIGYRGFVDLMWRSGNVTGMHADVVYEGDKFSYAHGSNMHLEHIPRGGRAGREALNAYAYVKLRYGEEFEVMEYADVLKIRDGSEGYRSALRDKENGKEWAFKKSPWVAFEHDMALKTPLRRLAKFVPMSLDVSRAASIDLGAERQKVDFTAIAEDPENAMLGFDDSSQEDDDAPSDDVAEGADAKDGQAHKDDPARDDGLAKDRPHEAVRKPKTVAPAKQQGRRSFFGDDA